MARLMLPLAVVLLVTISTASGSFSCPQHLPCHCITNDESTSHTISCSTNSATNSAFEITIQPKDLVHIRCENSPDWSRLLKGAAVDVGPVSEFVFADCAPPGPMYSSKIVDKQLKAQKVEYLKYENLAAPLSAEDLDVFPDVKHLVLSNNRLGELVVQPDLLRGLPVLQILELRNTNIQIPQGFFNKSSFLKTLELSNNNLKSLAPGVFDGLKQIELLNVWKNDLQELKPGVFGGLQSLVTLDIHQNNLKTLPVNIFADLKNLENINFSVNNFTSLPADLFLYNPKLKTVKLSYNKVNLTTLPGGLFSNFADLTEVTLMRSGILYLPENLFWGSNSIIKLNLNRNYLQTLPYNLLKDCTELQTLSLSFNDLKDLDDGIFSSNTKLVKLDLSKNHLKFIGEHTFAGLESLQELNMEYNELSHIDVQAFDSLEQLKFAMFANNKLTLQSDHTDGFGEYSPFHSCSSLEELNLAHNNITQMYSDWTITGTHLRILDLSYNNFKSLQAEDLQFMSNNIQVDLRHNNIQHINLALFQYISAMERGGPAKLGRGQVSVFLSFNPIQCGCEVYDLVRYYKKQMDLSTQSRVKLFIDDMTCDGPEHMAGLLVSQLNLQSIKCLMAKTCVPDSTCQCWMKPSDNSLILDCSGRNLTSPPAWIDTHGSERVELDLSKNELKTGPNMSAKGYNKVVSLNLSENNIVAVKESLITPKLEILNLDGNKLTSINSKVLNRLSNGSDITQLTLRNNPWSCNCSSREMLYFIRMGYLARYPDFLDITCRDSNVSLSELSFDELCSPSNHILIYICLSIGVFFSGLLVSFAAICAMPYLVMLPKKIKSMVHDEKSIPQLHVTSVDETAKNDTVIETVLEIS